MANWSLAILTDVNKKREASSRERFGTGKKGERSISGTHNFQSKVPAGKRDYLFWNSFFPRHFLVERTKKSCSIYKRTSISVTFLWIVNSHYLQTHGSLLLTFSWRKLNNWVNTSKWYQANNLLTTYSPSGSATKQRWTISINKLTNSFLPPDQISDNAITFLYTVVFRGERFES